MSAICDRGSRINRSAKRSPLLLCGLLLFSLLLPGCGTARRYSVTWADVFDTVTTFTAYTRSRAEFDALADRLHGYLQEEHRRFDIYREYDDTVNLCTVNRRAAGEAVSVDQDLMALLLFAREMYGRSGKKLNIALGPVLRLWEDARKHAAADPASAAPPDPSVLAEAAEHCRMEDLVLDPEAGTVHFLDPVMGLDVGAVAKGWAQAGAMDLLNTLGCRDYLLNMGGSVSCRGHKSGGKAWSIGLEDPLDKAKPMRTFPMTDSSAVTSGIDQRYFLANGTRYHHLIDPDTGCPGDRYSQVTILLPDPALADALSTALFLLDRNTGLALAEELDAQVLWIYPDGRSESTEGFPKLS